MLDPTHDRPRFIVVATDLAFLNDSPVHTGSTPDERSMALGRALAASPMWRQIGNGTLVLRHGPQPVLAVLGRFAPADVARIEVLARWVETAVRGIVFLDYTRVTAAVRELAAKLRGLFGSELDGFDFMAVPRGGFVVQGLLSYALELDGERLVPSDDPDRPLVVVDDCALTGSRVREIIRRSDRRRIIFAHLCSPPELRRAMEASEPALTHAVAGFDLKDLAPERMGSGYAEWRRLVGERLGEDRYWIGQAEEVVFPWNEPDHNFWNPVTEEMEWGWRVVPPELCLKNAATGPLVPIQQFAPAQGPVMPADHIVSGELGNEVYVLDLRDGGTLALEGAAALIWDRILAGSGPEPIAAEIAGMWDLPLQRATHDVSRFVEELVARGVLLRTASSALES